MLFRSLRTTLAAVGRDRPISSSLAASETAPLDAPPESMRPDRPEVMTRVGEGPQLEIAPGVRFECLVGSHNQARRLTTGIVTFAPGAVLPYHTHSFAEAITLLHGAAQAEIEGRSYALKRLDCVAVPAGLAHSVRNRSTSEPAVFHIAMASESPARTLVEKFFPKRPMPDDSPGHAGAERVTRCSSAPRGIAGPNTEFIDCYNDTLLPGFGMSGGYGLFHHGGRLPAHVHDFDESITIISGDATCIVEGRRYELADYATALQPRGRVHYFRNDAAEPMEMIWVYAGPQPERIVVAERCATAEGNPWK
jgi:quercetin dioxygenase-like cupin family protein